MRYLGNKTRLLKNIEDFIKENDIEGRIFCDLFAGSGSVGDYFKCKYEIIANDFLKFSYILNKAKLSFKNIPNFNKFKKTYKQDIFEYLNKKEYNISNDYFLTKEYSPIGNRMFFTETNAKKIDGIRLEIEQLYKDEMLNENEYTFVLASLIENVLGISNTTGTYEAFLKKWDNRALKNIELKPLEFNKTEKIYNNTVYNLDANILVKQIKGDILYIDPPYTLTEYSSAYHVLETLTKYDIPMIKGITGRRIYNDKKSKFSKKQTALIAFEDIIRKAEFRHIIISYSNQSIIPLKELELMLKKYSIDNKVIIKKIPYREYRNIRSSQKSDILYEVLIYINKNLEIIKSPLNYSGSKDKIVDQIIANLPQNIDTFVDAMGGAFNVGVNINVNNVVYNEYNRYVFEIISMLLESNKDNLINRIKSTIKEYKLKKEDKDSYRIFREYYNKESKDIFNLYILQMFCFQNQIRFNSKYEFNTPIGNCGYNETINERINKFIPKAKNITMINDDFKNIKYNNYDKNTLFYFDPPYFITNATYNDGKRGFRGWTAEEEEELLIYLKELDINGYKFMLSNVLEHKNKENKLLKEWVKTHGFIVKELISNSRKEVIIMNYEE